MGNGPSFYTAYNEDGTVAQHWCRPKCDDCKAGRQPTSQFFDCQREEFGCRSETFNNVPPTQQANATAGPHQPFMDNAEPNGRRRRFKCSMCLKTWTAEEIWGGVPLAQRCWRCGDLVWNSTNYRRCGHNDECNIS